MQPAGWIIMLFSVGSVLALLSFCLVRVLGLPAAEMEDLKGPLEIETGDVTNAD